jgi:hypothetical protein
MVVVECYTYYDTNGGNRILPPVGCTFDQGREFVYGRFNKWRIWTRDDIHSMMRLYSRLEMTFSTFDVDAFTGTWTQSTRVSVDACAAGLEPILEDMNMSVLSTHGFMVLDSPQPRCTDDASRCK